MLSGYGKKDTLLVKYDFLGNIVQASTIGGVEDDTFTQMIIKDNRVIIAGLSGSSEISASHFENSNFVINKLGEVDTLIVTLDRDFVIQEGMNLNGEEGAVVQEIGINQYTEQLMILSSTGVHTQRIVKDTLDYEVEYKNGFLKVIANEEIVKATLFDGTTTHDIINGIEVGYGGYEIKVTSVTGQTVTKVVSFSAPVKDKISMMDIVVTSLIPVSVLGIGVLLTLVIRKRQKEALEA